MRIGIAVDHGGYHLKEYLIETLNRDEHDVTDFGAYSFDSDDDYPDYVTVLSRAIADGQIDRGIAVCGSGVGACVVANKVPGVRAGLITDTFSAHQGVEDDNMNVLCLGARVVGVELARELMNTFLSARFSGLERHVRRIAKIKELEQEKGF